MKDDEAFDRDRDELEKLLDEEPRRRRRAIGIAIAAVAVAVVAAIGIGMAFGFGRVSASPGESPGISPSATDPVTSPAASASPEPDATDQSPAPATPAPDESDEGESEGDEPTAPDARETLPPAAFDDPIEAEGGLVVSVSSIESVTGEAVVPGEVSGPAVRVTVRIENESDETVDLTTAVVTLFGASELQASPVTKPAGKSFPLEVGAGKAASGAFVFELPKDERTDVRVEVDLSVAEPLIAFEGAVE
ncbi:DUF4352 domain-containing protein [Microbacterium sp.]|uniref:DUF4352 domain-containing protein n=1 Tax=Microbacterium sp. TaxID=51671 RepID=UPI0037352A44